MPKASRKETVQVAAFLLVLLILAWGLQNFEGLHRKYILSQSEPEVVSGTITSINLLPSNTGSPYAVTVELESGVQVKLMASLALAKRCKQGEVIKIEKRGLDYQFAEQKCGYD